MRQVGPYRVLRELARGGMGAVYEVVDDHTQTHFALKQVLPAGLLGAAGAEELLRFRREAELLARLDHPHLVRVHSANLEGDAPYLVQDLLPGGSLQERLQRDGPLPVEEAIAITTKLAAALGYAHEQGVLHRDLKPHNILFDDRGEPRLVDFGLGLNLLESRRLTATGTLMGTPGFMAPEQATGQKEPDMRTDVYGLGAVLYAMLTGQPPFSGPVLKVLTEVIKTPPLPPRSLQPGIPDSIHAACLKALAKRPEKRFPSAAALAQALTEPPQPRARRQLPVALGVLALILSALGVGLLATQRLEEPVEDATTVEAPKPPPKLKPNPAEDPRARRRYRELVSGDLQRIPPGIPEEHVALERRRRELDTVLSDRNQIDVLKIKTQSQQLLTQAQELLHHANQVSLDSATDLLVEIQRTLAAMVVWAVDNALKYRRSTRVPMDDALEKLHAGALQLSREPLGTVALHLAQVWHQWSLGDLYDPKILNGQTVERLSRSQILSERLSFLAGAMFLLYSIEKRFGQSGASFSPVLARREAVFRRLLAPDHERYQVEYGSVTVDLRVGWARLERQKAWPLLVAGRRAAAATALKAALGQANQAYVDSRLYGRKVHQRKANREIVIIHLLAGDLKSARQVAQRLPTLERETMLAECALVDGDALAALSLIRALITEYRLGPGQQGVIELWTVRAHARAVTGNRQIGLSALEEAAGLRGGTDLRIPWRTVPWTRKLIEDPDTWWPGKR